MNHGAHCSRLGPQRARRCSATHAAHADAHAAHAAHLLQQFRLLWHCAERGHSVEQLADEHQAKQHHGRKGRLRVAVEEQRRVDRRRAGHGAAGRRGRWDAICKESLKEVWMQVAAAAGRPMKAGMPSEARHRPRYRRPARRCHRGLTSSTAVCVGSSPAVRCSTTAQAASSTARSRPRRTIRSIRSDRRAWEGPHAGL